MILPWDSLGSCACCANDQSPDTARQPLNPSTPRRAPPDDPPPDLDKLARKRERSARWRQSGDLD